MAAEEKWYFTREQLANTPSRKCGYDADKELSCRQQAANFIQDMGQRLQVTQLCINTAIVYMHRFYMVHSFTRFHRNAMAAAALFLAAKVEEQPRKLEHVIKVAQICLHREQPPPDVKSEVYLEQAQELVVNENILLQTLGFDVAIDHPHTHVVRCCHLVRASKDLAQTSYFMASNSLHLTTMCLQYKPTLVACFCIHLACKWSNWEIPQSTEGKPWFWYVDKSVSQELLEQLTEEFLAIFDKCPSRLKKKITSLSSTQNPTILSAFSNEGDKKRNGEGSSSSNPSMAGISFGLSSEEMKKKQEYLRHHPDYKKHHIPHHARADSHSLSKSSCMFGPPTRPVPSSHSNANNASSTSNSAILRAVPSKPTMVDPVNILGKPEHLHHRPRRPDEKHVRNHELVSSQFKKYEKVSSGVISDFTSSNISNNSSNSNNICNNRVAMNVSSSSYLNVPMSHVQPSSNVYLQQQQQIPVQAQGSNQSNPISNHQQAQNIDTTGRVSVAELNSGSSSSDSQNVLGSLSKHQLLPAAPPTIVTIPQTSATSTKGKSPVLLPPPTKVERSIFSPEKSTPPSENSNLVNSSSQSPPPAQSIHAIVAQTVSSSASVVGQPASVVNISSTVSRKKNDPPDSSILFSQSKSEDTLKLNSFNQYHPALSETVKTELIPKEEKPPDIHKNEGTLPHSSETIVSQPLVNVPVSSTVSNPVDEPHTKEQKKKKKKHKDHKDKHKDKHKHKHKNRDPEPIVITIPKEKLSLPEQGLLKIKIPKDKITTPAATGLKIKIPKEKIKESRKRERSEERSASGGPGKFLRPNGTALQVTKEIDIMECSDSENDKPNLSLDPTNSPPIVLNDACPSFDDILRPGTPPGMSDVLLELFQTQVTNSSTVTDVTLENKITPSLQASAPIPASSFTVKEVTPKQLSLSVPLIDNFGLSYNENIDMKRSYQGRQNGGYNRGRYPAGRRRNRGYHLAPRIPSSQPPYMGGNNWDVLRHRPPVVVPPPLPPRYLLNPPPGIHPHFFPPTMIVPNYPPPPPLPDDPPPAQPPPPPPEY